MKSHLRWLLSALAAELRSAHAGSALGTFWLLLAPLLQVGMYVFLFQVVWRLRVDMHAGGSVPFAWYLVSAYLPIWAFQEALVRASSGLTGNAHIIRNTLFPAWLLVAAKALMPYAVLLVLCLPMWIGLHAFNLFQLDWVDAFWLPYVLMCQVLFTVGLGLLLASVSVMVRDLVNFLPPLLMGLVLTAPVLYPMSNVPEALVPIFWFNPLTAYAEAYHQLLLTGQGIGLAHALAMLCSASVATFLGLWAYRKIAVELPDLL
jgi:lipopolysaccharide transport system permease protein